MSATGLEVFDKTVQTTNTWLKEIMEVTGPDRRRAYRVLAAVLHALRDRLTVDEAAQLARSMHEPNTSCKCYLVHSRGGCSGRFRASGVGTRGGGGRGCLGWVGAGG